MIRVFVGQDDVENVAYHVLSNSIIRNSTEPVSIAPIKLSNLVDIYDRVPDENASNEFSLSRFLVPYLCNFDGYAIFMDCDMLMRADISELWAMRDPTKSVQVVKHDYTPKTKTKFLGQTQHDYPRKNWSSVMLFNCKKCKYLTPHYINTAPPKELHRFYWADSIGELPKEWNHLVGEYAPDKKAKLAHFTIGGPYFHDYRDTEFSDEWFGEYERLNNCDQIR